MGLELEMISTDLKAEHVFLQPAEHLQRQTTNNLHKSVMVFHCEIFQWSCSQLFTWSKRNLHCLSTPAQRERQASPPVGSSPLWSSRKWESGRAHQTWSKRRTAKQRCLLLRERKTLIRAAQGQRTERDSFHFLEWWQHETVLWERDCAMPWTRHGHETVGMGMRLLRTGHNQLVYMKMKLTPPPTYSCCLKRPSSRTGAK